MPCRPRHALFVPSVRSDDETAEVVVAVCRQKTKAVQMNSPPSKRLSGSKNNRKKHTDSNPLCTQVKLGPTHNNLGSYCIINPGAKCGVQECARTVYQSGKTSTIRLKPSAGIRGRRGSMPGRRRAVSSKSVKV